MRTPSPPRLRHANAKRFFRNGGEPRIRLQSCRFRIAKGRPLLEDLMMTMRFLVPLLITWALLGASLAERNSKDIKAFRVSKTGGNKELLLRLFEHIRSQEASKNSGRLARFRMELHVRQRVSSTTYLVDGEGEPYWFVAKKPLNKVDGDWLVCLAKMTDEVKRYTTVLKAKKTVRVIKEVDESELNLPPPTPPLTKEKFVEELKAGKTWTVTLVDNCKTCGGSGSLKSVSGRRPCGSCSGGRAYVTYSVRW